MAEVSENFWPLTWKTVPVEPAGVVPTWKALVTLIAGCGRVRK